MGGSVMAQDAFRLWKPYNPESFGGGHRSNDGVYSSLSGIYWSFSTPTGGFIGATTAQGRDETRWVYNLSGNRLDAQTNSVKVNMMDSSSTLGTRFEVGNRRGHHGWLVSGYGLPGQRHSMDVTNVTMAIRDEGNFSAAAYNNVYGGAQSIGYLWGSNFSTSQVQRYVQQEEPAGLNTTGWLPDPETGQFIYYTGLFPSNATTIVGDDGSVTVIGEGAQVIRENERYGYLPLNATYFLPEQVDDPGAVTIAPLPVVFDNVGINVRTRHQSAELMYTYRAQPFTWGSVELLAGARYWNFEDEFGFNGENILDVGADGTINTYGPIRAFENMTVDAKGNNRVFGPQIGIKLNRQNARWSFGAEGRFTAGINPQSVKTEGYFTPHRAHMPIGVLQDNVNLGDNRDLAENRRSNYISFVHKQNKTYFSPILEGRVSADWQWTSAVSFFGALDGMVADNIARGVRITDYVVKSDGTIFGIRGNDRNVHIVVYGAEFGIKILR